MVGAESNGGRRDPLETASEVLGCAVDCAEATVEAVGCNDVLLTSEVLVCAVDCAEASVEAVGCNDALLTSAIFRCGVGCIEAVEGTAG